MREKHLKEKKWERERDREKERYREKERLIWIEETLFDIDDNFSIMLFFQLVRERDNNKYREKERKRGGEREINSREKRGERRENKEKPFRKKTKVEER